MELRLWKTVMQNNTQKSKKKDVQLMHFVSDATKIPPNMIFVILRENDKFFLKKGDGEESGPKYDAQINPSRNDKKLKAKTDRKQKSTTFEIEKKVPRRFSKQIKHPIFI